MNIHEYQAKALLARYGLTVPRSVVVRSGEDAESAAHDLGGRVVVKAQVHAGGRGKAGGVALAESAAQTRQLTERMLGTRLVTKQTTAAGVPIETVLIEEAVDIAQELYCSVLVDSDVGAPVVVASAEGGMDIEQLAVESPDKIVYGYGDALVGVTPYKARDVALALGLKPQMVRAMQAVIGNLYRAFVENDCTLIELNPLVITAQDEFVVADAKISIEDDALFRHPQLEGLRDSNQMDVLECRAGEADLAYVKLDGGKVGCMVNGAGLAMATMDITLKAGANPANFLDIGGSAKQARIEEALRIVLADDDVEVVLVNLFAGIARADIVARAIAAAHKQENSTIPIVVVMRGTNAEEGLKILGAADLPVYVMENLTRATEKINELVG